ncbi:carboxymuconolactone decarboxylase family protein [Aquitalea sp. ASV11]|uniref:carboxymuconolactone decarboxylase family protein n=1 Tax=Aquitalea sp. ASV11 TaxID=2795103 RepID=UPI001E593CBF|nr:carboxymuconolactone decarboxylase family protein [Aquitalea sp. ASV11]
MKDNSMTNPKVTAGRDQLGDFAPKFAEINDDILFGQVWSRDVELSQRDRSLITVTALVSSGILDGPLSFHMQTAKNNGIAKDEIVEILTHLAFYIGWPKAWGAFRSAKEIWSE